MKNLKRLFTTLLTVSCLIISSFNSSAQSVGINATQTAPDPSALLDLNSTSKGFLITRVDTANIISPAFGLMTLSPVDSCLYLYSGNKWMGMGGAGSNCICNGKVLDNTTPKFPCDGTVIPVIDVTSITGKKWMDRNLGSSQVATSITDVESYGDLYQWGRCSDGHEKRNSGETAVKSSTDTPGHGNFITTGADWRVPENDNLWQGATGVNNPCPTGYRLPTDSELDAERLSWSTDNREGAFASPLKLPAAGMRPHYGTIKNVGTHNYYWSSTKGTAAGQPNAKVLNVSTSSSLPNVGKILGCSVRCIKD